MKNSNLIPISYDNASQKIRNYAFRYDDSALISDDRVLLVIQRYDTDKKQIYGKIVAKV